MPWRLTLLAVIALGTLAVSGCQHRPEFPTDGNVILVTVDTLRADYLGCYGHRTIETPAINGLAGAGIRFSRAYAQSHITLPSHVSILTSLYPKDHGVTENVRSRIDPDILPLATVLKKAGFRTFAATSNRILSPGHVRGLARGFDRFEHSSSPERRAALTNRVFFRWLQRNHRHRFFAWIHYFDPHLPYVPPRTYQSMYYDGDPRDPRFTSMNSVVFPAAWTVPESPAQRLISWLGGIRDFRYVVSQYEGEISYVDAMVGELLARLAALGLDRKTLVVFTADHGESLGEHGIYLRHTGLYEPSTHVPLIFWAPEVLRHPRVVDALVMSVDIMPTVLDLLGIAPAGAHMAGRSLLPLLTGGTTKGPHRYVYAERTGHSQVMVRSAEWKYVKTLTPVELTPGVRLAEGHRELFHLASDPGEGTNMYAQEPERARELDAAVARWQGRAPDAVGPRRQPTGEPAEYLKALGYVE